MGSDPREENYEEVLIRNSCMDRKLEAELKKIDRLKHAARKQREQEKMFFAVTHWSVCKPLTRAKTAPSTTGRHDKKESNMRSDKIKEYLEEEERARPVTSVRFKNQESTNNSDDKHPHKSPMNSQKITSQQTSTDNRKTPTNQSPMNTRKNQHSKTQTQKSPLNSKKQQPTKTTAQNNLQPKTSSHPSPVNIRKNPWAKPTQEESLRPPDGKLSPVRTAMSQLNTSTEAPHQQQTATTDTTGRKQSTTVEDKVNAFMLAKPVKINTEQRSQKKVQVLPQSFGNSLTMDTLNQVVKNAAADREVQMKEMLRRRSMAGLTGAEQKVPPISNIINFGEVQKSPSAIAELKFSRPNPAAQKWKAKALEYAEKFSKTANASLLAGKSPAGKTSTKPSTRMDEVVSLAALKKPDTNKLPNMRASTSMVAANPHDPVEPRETRTALAIMHPAEDADIQKSPVIRRTSTMVSSQPQKSSIQSGDQTAGESNQDSMKNKLDNEHAWLRMINGITGSNVDQKARAAAEERKKAQICERWSMLRHTFLEKEKIAGVQKKFEGGDGERTLVKYLSKTRQADYIKEAQMAMKFTD